MLIEAFVQKRISENTFQCIIGIDKNTTREQLFTFYPVKKRNERIFLLENIVNEAIYIWKDPKQERETMYIGKIIFIKQNTIYIINQAIEEIYKRIE